MPTAHQLDDAALGAMSVRDLETHLDAMHDLAPRPYLLRVMAARNAKVRQEELDAWGLSEEEYAAAERAAAADQGKQPLHAHLNRARVAALRKARNAQTAQTTGAQASATAHMR